jgi:hypothetical protein
MKSLFLYRKWNFILFLNNAIGVGFFGYNKKILALRFEMSQFIFWIYKKKVKFQNFKVLNLKQRFKFF